MTMEPTEKQAAARTMLQDKLVTELLAEMERN